MTLFELTCDWAQGDSTANDVFQSVWSQIATRSATGYRYWIGQVPHLSWNTTRGLIVWHNNRCGAWKRFFHDLRAIHGIAVAGYTLTPISPREGLRVPADQPGQGYPPLPDVNQFTEHAVNAYGGSFYDASYGTGPFSDLIGLEDASIEAYYVGGGWQSDVKGVLELNATEGL